MRSSARHPAPARPTAEGIIDRLDDDGAGITRLGGREVRVPLALPGERVVIEGGGRWGPARAVEILSASADRVASPCQMAGGCAGCPLIVASYQAQLEFKQQRVVRALAAYPRLSPAVLHDIWPAPAPLGYRASVKLAVGIERGKIALGMIAAAPRRIVDVTRCPVHHPLVNRVALAVRDELRGQRPALPEGLVRFVAIRVSPALGRAMITLVTGEREVRALPRIAKGIKARVAEVVGIHENVNPRDTPIVLGRDTFRLLGAADLHDVVGGIRLAISPTAFFQVNHAQAARIYRQVQDWAALTRADRALDLYCGIGGIALHLARDAGKVMGVEVVAEAVEDARANARTNGLANCSFRAGDVAALIREVGRGGEPAVAVVNPPRSGCHPGVIDALGELAPRALIYVSCDPGSLARDLDLLAGRGFALDEVQPVDMFPQTGHVECVARLHRRG